MANYFDAFLSGVLGKGTQFKDFQHASRLYVDDLYALAPKQGFLYYVVFNINQKALASSYWKNVKQREVAMLVKACDLPKFNVATEVLNQYNRKTYVQSKLTYQPVSFVFHDDHSNATTGLWHNYYSYYFADTKQGSASSLSTTPTGFKDTKYETNTEVFQHTTYGLNNQQDKAFFDSIAIYQLNRKEFTSFILINPLITEWTHDRLEQSTGGKMLENKMTVGYEAVLYGCGTVKKDKPSGFATFHYDLNPSPLSVLGGGSSSVFGPGGVISGINELFGTKPSMCGEETSGSPLNLLQMAIGGANILRNAKNLTKGQIASEGLAMLGGAIKGFGNTGNLPSLGVVGTGVAGIGLSLFKGSSAGSTTVARQSKITSPTVSQVQQSDIPITGDNPVAFDTDLPNPLPTDNADLEVLKTDQLALQQNITDEILRNTELKADFDQRIAAAREAMDDEGLNAIYDEMNAVQYTDPDKLYDILDRVNSNIDLIQSEIDFNTEAESQTLGRDDVELGESPDAELDSSINTDYELETSDVNIAYGDDDWPKEDYI